MSPSGAAPYRVLIVPQAFYALGRGGIEVQQDRTIEALRTLGVDVECYDPWSTELRADLIHVFGSEYPQADLVQRLHQTGRPVVLTSMFMPQHPLWKYRWLARIGTFLPNTTVGLRQRTLRLADRVIAISEQERSDLQGAFQVDPTNVSVIANGIEERFFTADKQAFLDRYGLDDVILCVGSIEPRKNQLTVARALADVGRPVVFIGPAAPHGGANVADYVQAFQREVDASPNLHWIQGLDHHDPALSGAYAAARVHILVSTAEAQGLVSMEAMAAGAQVIVSDLPQMRELFTSDVTFSSTTDQARIRADVLAAAPRPRHDWSKQARPSWLMSWDEVARRLDEVYRSVLARHVA